MKVGVIGCGYWGKIIINNLISLGYEDLVLCDRKDVLDSINIGRKFESVEDYKDVKCDKVFVLTPSSEHYDVCRFFLEKKIDVFCEKVLTTDVESSSKLYGLARLNECNLFVDWIFTFNKQINDLKNIYQSGKLGRIKHATMNRQNFGPVRFDVGAKIDLASHDVSILFHVFNQDLVKASWNCYKRDSSSKQNDSTAGVLQFQDFTSLINVSWQYSKKDRMCYFDFEKGFVTWDDTKKKLLVESDIAITTDDKVETSPLHESINNFLNNKDFDYSQQEKITLNTIGALK